MNPQFQQPSDIDVAVKMFTDTIVTTLNSVTSKSYPSPPEDKPDELTFLLRAKTDARKKWQNTRDPQAKRAYYRYQRAIRRKHKLNKINSFSEKVVSLQPSGKEFWKITKHLLGKSTQIKSTPLENAEHQMIYDSQQKAETFADSLYLRFQPHHDISDPAFTKKITDEVNLYLQQTPTEQIPITSPKEVKDVIKTLPLHKSSGPDGISPLALKRMPKRALVHLTKIYNACLKFLHFPSQWKEATVITIAKPGKDPTLPNSYRPISLLDFLGKVL